MRLISVTRDSQGKYVTSFLINTEIKWQIISYVIVSHEIMVDWIEKGIHPDYRYT